MSFQSFTSPETRILWLDGPFTLEGGGILDGVQVAYRSWGHLDPSGDNAVLVCHALTGSADVDQWWERVLGPGRALDPDRDFVVAANVLGGCYGTTGPGTPISGFLRGMGPEFPKVTIRDQVRLQALLLEALGVCRLSLVVGGSMGGMHALEWAVMEPLPVEAVAVIGAPARHSPWAIGLGEIQRRAIQEDPAWMGGWYEAGAPPLKGLSLARSVAMCSYRGPESFHARFRRDRTPTGGFQVESYLRHQGRKLGARFDANSYLVLSRAMDSHDLARNRMDLADVLRGIGSRVLVVGIPSDVLYVPGELEDLARGIPGAELAWVESPHGHDAFLMEQEEISSTLAAFRSGERMVVGVSALRPSSGFGVGGSPVRPSGTRRLWGRPFPSWEPSGA